MTIIATRDGVGAAQVAVPFDHETPMRNRHRQQRGDVTYT